MEEKKQPGRPRKSVEAKMTRSIRLEPSKKALIEEQFGSVQAWVDAMIENQFQAVFVTEIVPADEDEITEDDF